METDKSSQNWLKESKKRYHSRRDEIARCRQPHAADPELQKSLAPWDKLDPTLSFVRPDIGAYSEQEISALISQFTEALQAKLHFVSVTGLSSNVEHRLSELESRMNVVENQINEPISPPARRLQTTEIAFLRDNRDEIKSRYAGQWIAVLNNELLGSSSSLKDLRANIKSRSIDDATYVHVSDPLAPQP